MSNNVISTTRMWKKVDGNKCESSVSSFFIAEPIVTVGKDNK